MRLFGLDITRAAEKRASPENPQYSLDDPNLLSAISAGTLGGMGGASRPVSPQRAMQTSAVFACVRILSESLAQLPVKVLEKDASGAVHEVTQIPLATLLGTSPNSYQSGFQFREMGQAHCALWGNFYAEILKNKLGEVVGLYPLNAWGCTPRMVGTEKVYDVNGVTLRDDEVLHIPALGYDGIKGLSPIAMHRTSIGMTLAAEEFGAGFYANGTRLAGVLEHPQSLSDGAGARLRENWSNVYAGAANSGKVAVLEEGMKFNPLTMPLEDAQYIESRKFQVTDIARIYRIPPHMVGDLDRATFSNIEQQGIEFVVHTMMPWVARWEQEINRRCFPQNGRQMFVKFNLGGLLRGDLNSRYTAYSLGRQWGWLSINDIRALEDMNPIADGDTYLQPLNMQPAGTPPPDPDKSKDANGN